MGNKIRIILAVLVIIGVAYWSINLVRQRSYSGSQFAFKVGRGSVVVNNQGQQAIPVEMRSEGRSANFRVESAELGLKENSKRQSSGRDTFHVVTFELPSGQAQIKVVRGSNIFFVSSSSQPISAVVTPLSPGSTYMTLIFAGLVIAGALYYISSLQEHRWVGAARSKLTKLRQRPKGAAA